jgi:hypothetical protein
MMLKVALLNGIIGEERRLFMMDGVYPSWLVPGHVILLQFEGDYPVDAMQHLDIWLKTALDSVDTPQVYLMGDLTRMGQRWPPLHEQLRFKSVHHPRVGRVITINAAHDRILRFCIGIVLRATGKPYRDFDTFEQAASYLREIDHSLNLPSGADSP